MRSHTELQDVLERLVWFQFLKAKSSETHQKLTSVFAQEYFIQLYLERIPYFCVKKQR